jgi:hypothetical protein
MPTLEYSGTYAVSLQVPGNGECAPRATHVPGPGPPGAVTRSSRSPRYIAFVRRVCMGAPGA